MNKISELKEEFRQKKKFQKSVAIQNILGGLGYFVIVVISFYLMESFQHNPFKEVRPKPQILNVILLELIAWITFFVIGSGSVAIRIYLVACLIFGLTSYYVMQFRSTPFVPWDFFSIKTASSVAKNYDYRLRGHQLVVVIFFMILIMAAHFIKIKLKKKILWHVVPSVVTMIVLCLFTEQLQTESFQNKNDLYPFLFTPVYMAKVNGSPVTFAMDLSYIVIDKPAGYSKEKARQILKKYESKNQKAKNQKTKTPNIIVIMDEAFSDLGVLGEMHTSEDPMPFIHSLQKGQKNTITGELNVSVCGGNTANTEFEFLTGNTMAFLPNGSIPYQQYITGKIDSLPNYLKTMGYETYAIHPYFPDGWNRENVYDYMEFDKFYSINDFENPLYIRDYISDESDMLKIISTYKNKRKNKSAFIFNVTMQNHGSYYDQHNNFTPRINVTGSNNFSLSQYLSLTRKTDEDFQKLIEYFQKEDDDTIIVFFGDHQPSDAVAGSILALNGKDAENLSSEDLKKRYKVPYVIWANFDIKEGKEENTSVNYLAAKVLKVAGIKTNSYQNFLLDLNKKQPIISSVNQPSKNEKTNDYKIVQYYEVFDKKGDN
ncbi:Phosphoglycerol transferase MdoB [Lachnospiraceae bacterium C7]|nr:Phosphoglycerol transferase MdoB [Lachnospiraceae bacterium C7]